MPRKKDMLAADNALVRDIRSLIEEARSTVATTVNAVLTMLYWRVGRRINEEILKGDRAGYGERIVHALSAQLYQEYGQGFTKRNLELEKSSIRVAEYLTELPSREVLERELHKALVQARQRFALRQQLKKEVGQ